MTKTCLKGLENSTNFGKFGLKKGKNDPPQHEKSQNGPKMVQNDQKNDKNGPVLKQVVKKRDFKMSKMIKSGKFHFFLIKAPK